MKTINLTNRETFDKKFTLNGVYNIIGRIEGIRWTVVQDPNTSETYVIRY